MSRLQPSLPDCSSYQQFESELNLQIFGLPSLKNREVLLQSLLQCRSSLKTACNKRINPGDLSFECQNCALDLECHLICESCFLRTHSAKTNGHKFRYFSGKAGLCDCGNAAALDSHCPDHDPNVQSKLDENIIQEYIPGKVSGEIVRILCEFLWDILRVCEREERPGIEKEKDREFNVNSKLMKGFRYFFKFLLKLLELQSPAMHLLLISVFQMKVQRELWHVCANYLLIQFEEKTPKICQCSFLDALFRLSVCLRPEKLWKNLIKVLEGLMKYPEFRKSIAVSYARHWNFVVYIPKYPNLSSLRISPFLDIYPHFFAKDCSEVWLKSFHFLGKLIEKTGDIIDCFFTSLNVAAYNAFDRIKSMFFFILKRSPVIFSLTESHTLELFIEIINKTHNPKNLIEEDNEKCRLHIECTLLMIFKNFLSLLLRGSEQSKAKSPGFFDGIIAKILEFLKEIYQKQEVIDRGVKNRWPLHNTLQRSLVLVMISSMMTGTEDFAKALEGFRAGFLAKIKGFFAKEQEFFARTVQTLLVSIKFSQEKVKPVNFYEIFENPFEGMKREVINGFYKKSYYLQGDYDMVLLQLLAMINGNNAEFLRAFAQSFDIDLPQIFFKANDDLYKKNLRNLLSNLIFLVNDETSLLNSSGFLDFSMNPSLSDFRRHALRFLVVNSFNNSKVKDLKTIKSLLYDKVLSFDIDIEEKLLKELTFTLPNTTILRLKPEFSEFYDPYIFYKYPKLTNDCYDGIKKLSQKNPRNDLIIGNELDPTRSHLSPLYFVRKEVFSTDLVRYLSLIFKIEAFTKEFDEILKSSLKLVFLCLRTVEEALFLDKCGNNELLFSNYKKYCHVPDFAARLEALKGQKTFAEARGSLENVIEKLKSVREQMSIEPRKQELSAKLEGKSLEEIDESPLKERVVVAKVSPNEESKTADRKAVSLQKRREKLKKDFMEKQKVFLQKNPSLLEEIKPNVPQASVETPTCFYCYEALNVDSSFGVSVYITQDSLCCRPKGRLSDLFKKTAKGESSFSMTSCLHYVHRDCNDKMAKNNLKALLDKKILYNSILESLCGHCKALNNLFVYFNEEKVLSTKYSLLKSSHLDLELSSKSMRDILSQLSLAIPVKSTVNPMFLSTFMKDSQEFFDLFLRIFLSSEELAPKFSKSETSLLSTLLEILKNSGNNVSLSGLSLFLKRNRPVYRNVYLMFREYFWSFQAKEKEKLVEGLKSEADSILAGLFEDCRTVDLEELDAKTQKLVWIIAIFFKNEDSTLYLMISRIFHRLFAIFQVYYGYCCFLSLFPDRKQTPDFVGLQAEFERNSEYRSFLMANMSQITRKMIGTLTVMFRFEELELQMLSPEKFPTDEAEFEYYKGNFDPSIFSFRWDTSDEYLSCFLGRLAKLKSESGLKAQDLLDYYPMNFHILSLPRSYFELQQALGLKKCELCGDFPLKGMPYLCLICGTVLCSVDCRQSLERNEKSIGNLNSHARSLHAGKGGFMNLRSSLIILMNYPRSISWGNLYKDAYGESVNERTWKWEKFELDVKMYNKIQDMMIGKRVPQEVCYRLMENEELVVDIDYL